MIDFQIPSVDLGFLQFIRAAWGLGSLCVLLRVVLGQVCCSSPCCLERSLLNVLLHFSVLAQPTSARHVAG